MARIVLHPGYVSSGSGGELRFVGAMALARAYGIDYPAANVVVANFIYTDDDVHLFPRFDGNYQRPALVEGEG